MPPRSKKTKEILNQEVTSSTSPKEENGDVNQYKDYSKVFTPLAVGIKMVELLELDNKHSVLEPSAGKGNLIYALRKSNVNIVDYFELNENHNTQLFLTFNNVISRGENFLDAVSVPKYDRIIANPPFDLNKWLIHIPKMYKCLAPKGVLVTLAPVETVAMINSSISDKLFVEFRAKMKELGAESYPVDNWYINKDGSKTEIYIIKIRKQ